MKNYTSTINLPHEYNNPHKTNSKEYLLVHKEECNKVTTDLYRFIKDINSKQKDLLGSEYSNTPSINILFNKGRYIEFSAPNKETWLFIIKSAKIKKFYNTHMIVCGKDKIEAVVSALNKQGFVANLNLDWI